MNKKQCIKTRFPLFSFLFFLSLILLIFTSNFTLANAGRYADIDQIVSYYHNLYGERIEECMQKPIVEIYGYEFFDENSEISENIDELAMKDFACRDFRVNGIENLDYILYDDYYEVRKIGDEGSKYYGYYIAFVLNPESCGYDSIIGEDEYHLANLIISYFEDPLKYVTLSSMIFHNNIFGFLFYQGSYKERKTENGTKRYCYDDQESTCRGYRFLLDSSIDF